MLGVIYLLTGAQHAARLVVSLYSLRQWYDGPITIFATRDESCDIRESLARERRLRIELASFDESEAGHNSSYLTKVAVLAASPYEATLFLDADTLVVGDISALLSAVRDQPLVVTGFCDWKTTDEWVLRRIDRWRPLAGTEGDKFELDKLIHLSSSVPMAAINVGVFGFGRDQPLLAAWGELTEFGRDTLLPDEVALQLLLPRYPHTVLSTQFNCSPAYNPHRQDVRIWHFVARTHLGHPESRQLWLPVYQQCYENRIADIDQWSRVDQTTEPTEPMIAPIPQPGDYS